MRAIIIIMTMTPPTVLITGASSGIGLELAHVFAAHGENLVLVARDSDRLQKLANTLSKQYGLRVEAITLDLTKPDAVDHLVKTLKKEAIQIDTLINNAGFGLYGDSTTTSWKTEQNMIDLNISVVNELSKHFAHRMVKRGQGRIMNVASVAAFFPGVYMSTYYASKAYVMSYTLALAEEVASHGVVVTALCPGPTKSGFVQRAHADHSRLFSRTMSARTVAEQAYRGLKRGRRIIIPGWKNKAAVFVTRFLPHRMIASLVRRAN